MAHNYSPAHLCSLNYLVWSLALSLNFQLLPNFFLHIIFYFDFECMFQILVQLLTNKLVGKIVIMKIVVGCRIIGLRETNISRLQFIRHMRLSSIQTSIAIGHIFEIWLEYIRYLAHWQNVLYFLLIPLIRVFLQQYFLHIRQCYVCLFIETSKCFLMTMHGFVFQSRVWQTIHEILIIRNEKRI